MNRLHSFIFSLLFSSAIFLCSASEQPIVQSTQNDNTSCPPDALKTRAHYILEQAHLSTTYFTKAATLLKDHLKRPDGSSLERNEYRLQMAKNLKPIIQQITFHNTFSSYMTDKPCQESHSLNYLFTIQKQLKDIQNSPITIETIREYEIIVPKLIRPLSPSDTHSDFPPKIYTELKHLEIDLEEAEAQLQTPVIQKKLNDFMLMIHQQESTKK